MGLEQEWYKSFGDSSGESLKLLFWLELFFGSWYS